jgi:NADP-dependent 3-hydroxy acid dehydrogenase YdfG
VTVSLAGTSCVVTGASSGIGRAIARSLAEAGGTVYAVGRRGEELETLAATVEGSGELFPMVADLESDSDLESLASTVLDAAHELDVLVHSAGAITIRTFDELAVSDLDYEYRVNVRAPFELTRTLLPALRRARGQLVFVNSNAALNAGESDVAYAATKAGLRGLADGVRAHVNPDGVRVLSVFAGRTATPMQETIHEREGRTYRTEFLLQPEDVAGVVISSLLLPRTGEITDIMVRPMRKHPEAAS